MQRQRGELVPIGEVVADLDGPVQAIRDTSPQARHHFTQADQVNQLVSASEADADLGFMARTMALCSLPRTNPGDRLRYVRCNGPYTLVMNAGGLHKLPFGNLPRLLMAWVSTEAVRTQSRELVLGDSLSEFMRTLGIYSSSGGTQTRLRNQMKRLFGCRVSLIYQDEHGEARVSSLVADRAEFWWDERKPDDRSLWDSKIRLGEDLFKRDHPASGSAGHEHPRGPQAFAPGPRFLPLAQLPQLRAVRSASAFLAGALPAVRSGPGEGKRQAHRQRFPHGLPARVEEDQDRLAGVELHDRQGRIDPVALEARDCTHDRPTASRGVAPGSLRSDRTRAGCFRWRLDDVPWQSRKPTSERTTQNRKIPSGASGGRCAGSSSRSSNWTTPIRRARNASSSARRPVNASRSDERGPGTPFFLPATAERLRALLRAVFGIIHRSLWIRGVTHEQTPILRFDQTPIFSRKPSTKHLYTHVVKDQVVKTTSSRSDDPVDNSLQTKEKPPKKGANAPQEKAKSNPSL